MADEKPTSEEKKALKIARQAFQELYFEVYGRRWKIYFMNFVRGIAFGVGSVIGATIVVALIIWLLAWLGGLPVIGDYFQGVQDTIQDSSLE